MYPEHRFYQQLYQKHKTLILKFHQLELFSQTLYLYKGSLDDWLVPSFTVVSLSISSREVSKELSKNFLGFGPIFATRLAKARLYLESSRILWCTLIEKAVWKLPKNTLTERCLLLNCPELTIVWWSHFLCIFPLSGQILNFVKFSGWNLYVLSSL